MIARFEAGKGYTARSIGDSECIFTIAVISRTEKTAVIIDNEDHKRRVKIHIGRDGGEYIMPERYSMAPVFRAEREEETK
jgi:hypothetical protein